MGGSIGFGKRELLKFVNFKGYEVQDNWTIGYESLVRYKAKNKHLNISQKYQFDDFKLGMWVSKIRTQYKEKKLDPASWKSLNKIARYCLKIDY